VGGEARARQRRSAETDTVTTQLNTWFVSTKIIMRPGSDGTEVYAREVS
jgi:hypothetical protein